MQINSSRRNGFLRIYIKTNKNPNHPLVTHYQKNEAEQLLPIQIILINSIELKALYLYTNE